MFVAGSMRSFHAMPLRSPFVQRSWLSSRQRIPMRPPSLAKTLPSRVYERDAFSFMSLSLIMTASTKVSDSLYFFAEVDTASETRRHCDGVQAGVCQRIFSFTAQIVLVRQSPRGAADWTTGSPVVGGGAMATSVRVTGLCTGGGVEAFA